MLFERDRIESGWLFFDACRRDDAPATRTPRKQPSRTAAPDVGVRCPTPRTHLRRRRGTGRARGGGSARTRRGRVRESSTPAAGGRGRPWLGVLRREQTIVGEEWQVLGGRQRAGAASRGYKGGGTLARGQKNTPHQPNTNRARTAPRRRPRAAAVDAQARAGSNNALAHQRRRVGGAGVLSQSSAAVSGCSLAKRGCVCGATSCSLVDSSPVIVAGVQDRPAVGVLCAAEASVRRI